MLFLSSESSSFCVQTDGAGTSVTATSKAASVIKAPSSSGTATGTGSVATTTSKGAAERGGNRVPVGSGVFTGLMALVAWLL